jgi:hypothetical protein
VTYESVSALGDQRVIDANRLRNAAQDIIAQRHRTVLANEPTHLRIGTNRDRVRSSKVWWLERVL